MTECCLLSGQEKQSILITRTLKFGKGDLSVVGQLGVIPLNYVNKRLGQVFKDCPDSACHISAIPYAAVAQDNY